jgi:prolyl 4-hydroxylase
MDTHLNEQLNEQLNDQFDEQWRNWIDTNLANGLDKAQLFNILLDNGFQRELVAKTLDFTPTPKDTFTPQWSAWLAENIEAGADKNALFKICLDEGFSREAIEKAMAFSPTVDLNKVKNPLKQTAIAANAVDISKLHITNAKHYQSGPLQVFVVHNFLNTEECNSLEAQLFKQLASNGLSGLQSDQNIRTGGACHFDSQSTGLLQDLERRLCKLIAIDPSYAEPLQGQVWNTDSNTHVYLNALDQSELNMNAGLPGDRLYAVSVYLNTTPAGGETSFINTDINLKPSAGMAVIWSNTDAQGAPLHQSLRRTQPVLKGHKAVLTKWFRSHSSASEAPLSFNRDANEIIPAYTRAGFCKRALPSHLFTKITDFYTDNSASIAEETVEGGYIQSGKNSTANGSSLIDLTTDLRREIHDELKAGMEQWSGVELLPTYVYGIRIYHRGAVLRPHRDRLATHIIGAIINVAQDVDEDWPLEIYDHQHRKHEVILKPGEMIFYESGSLIHGRSTPLNGNAFANIFCHCKPVNYEPTPVING